MQRVLSWLTLACVLALLGPAAALAANGPSAGDQQYIDPLTGTTTHHSTSPGSSSGTAQATPSAPTSTSGTSASSGVTTVAQATPTATTASSSTATDPAGTLPRTGFDAWIAVAFGIGLLACGVCLRLAVRGAS